MVHAMILETTQWLSEQQVVEVDYDGEVDKETNIMSPYVSK